MSPRDHLAGGETRDYGRRPEVMDTRRAFEIFGGFMIGAGVTVAGYELAGSGAPVESAPAQEVAAQGDGFDWPELSFEPAGGGGPEGGGVGSDDAVLAE